MATIPTVKFSDFKKFITSPEIVAVGSAILVTPLIQATVESLVGSIPVVQNHATIALIIAAFVIFILASRIKMMMFRAVALGVAGGLLITAIEPFVSNAIGGE